MIEIKTDAEVRQMRRAGLVVGEILQIMRASSAPGVTPRELDALARRELAARGATSNFLGYGGFPATVCISVNDVVVHGIPSDEPFAAGDIVSIDFGAVVDGWHGDSAITFGIGDIAAEQQAMITACEDSLWAGIAVMSEGGRVRDIGAAVEDLIRSRGDYGILTEYGGHGIGTAMHQEPHVMNFRTRARGPKLQRGLVLAVEPMITLGSPDVVLLDDDWTVKTADGSWAAHVEHTIAVTPDGPWVLTALDGGAARLGELGVATPAASPA
jgi:methionyl aminopeptidase